MNLHQIAYVKVLGKSWLTRHHATKSETIVLVQKLKYEPSPESSQTKYHTMPIVEKNTTLGTTLYAPVYNVHMGLHVALVVTILSASNTCQNKKLHRQNCKLWFHLFCRSEFMISVAVVD